MRPSRVARWIRAVTPTVAPGTVPPAAGKAPGSRNRDSPGTREGLRRATITSVERPSPASLLAPLLTLCLVVALVAAGAARGLWLANLHNGLLAFSFGIVGATVCFFRPDHREGWLYLGTGVLEAVMYAGRQVGHGGTGPAAQWWGWLGTWPVALAITASTWCVLCFPEGRFLSATWRRIGWAVLGLGALCSLLSALWPVEQAATGVLAPYPFALPGAGVAADVWHVLAHPAYVVLQLLWVPASVDRWRRSDDAVRRQLVVVVAAVAVAAAALVLGLATAGSPRAGLLATCLVPLAAGWAGERLSLAKVIETERQAGHLDGLTPRENDVLELMAQGLSNAAICERLHLSIKTVEPVVSSIFTKLGVPSGSASNRRVLAVVEYLRHRSAPG